MAKRIKKLKNFEQAMQEYQNLHTGYSELQVTKQQDLLRLQLGEEEATKFLNILNPYIEETQKKYRNFIALNTITQEEKKPFIQDLNNVREKFIAFWDEHKLQSKKLVQQTPSFSNAPFQTKKQKNGLIQNLKLLTLYSLQILNKEKRKKKVIKKTVEPNIHIAPHYFLSSLGAGIQNMNSLYNKIILLQKSNNPKSLNAIISKLKIAYATSEAVKSGRPTPIKTSFYQKREALLEAKIGLEKILSQDLGETAKGVKIKKALKFFDQLPDPQRIAPLSQPNKPNIKELRNNSSEQNSQDILKTPIKRKLPFPRMHEENAAPINKKSKIESLPNTFNDKFNNELIESGPPTFIPVSPKDHQAQKNLELLNELPFRYRPPLPLKPSIINPTSLSNNLSAPTPSHSSNKSVVTTTIPPSSAPISQSSKKIVSGVTIIAVDEAIAQNIEKLFVNSKTSPLKSVSSSQNSITDSIKQELQEIKKNTVQELKKNYNSPSNLTTPLKTVNSPTSQNISNKNKGR